MFHLVQAADCPFGLQGYNARSRTENDLDDYARESGVVLEGLTSAQLQAYHGGTYWNNHLTTEQEDAYDAITGREWIQNPNRERITANGKTSHVYEEANAEAFSRRYSRSISEISGE